MVETVEMTMTQYKAFLKNLKFGIANDLVNALVRRVAVDKGLLKQSIRYNVKGNIIEIVMLDTGLHVEFGTPPHIIKAKGKANGGADALHFGTGKGVTVKSVNHPGTRPQPFIRPTVRGDLPQIVLDNVRRHAK